MCAYMPSQWETVETIYSQYNASLPLIHMLNECVGQRAQCNSQAVKTYTYIGTRWLHPS